MRIVLAHKLWDVTGGAEVFFHETARVLREAGHETIMIATGHPSVPVDESVILLDAPKYDSGSLLTRAMHLPAAIYDFQKRRKISHLLNDFRPDIFHMFALNVHLSLSPIDAARDLDIPIVATFNDYKHICPNYKLFAEGKICFACKGYKFHNTVLKRCCKGSLALSLASSLEAAVHHGLHLYDKIDHFTFSSDFLAGVTKEFWPDRDFSWSKLRNPFNSSGFAASEEAEPYGLYFGRIIEEKGVDHLIDAAGEVCGFPIKIVGSGPDEQLLRDRVISRGLSNVEFMGPLWGPDLDVVLRRASFVIVPSIWHENFPYVINQAFAHARPVIGSNRGGITELVEHGVRGLIFEPTKPGDLAGAILELANNAQLRNTLGQNAKRWSDDVFSDQRTLEDLLTAYRGGQDAARRHRR